MRTSRVKKRIMAFAVAMAMSLGLAVPLGGVTTQPLIKSSAEETTTVATPEAETTTQAVAESVTMGTGFGVAIMAGENMTVSFGSASTVYIPIVVSEKGYLTIERKDESTDDIQISVLEKNKSTEVLKAEKVGGSEDTGAFAISAGDYYICVTGELGTDCVITAQMAAGVSMKIGKKTSLVLGKHSSSTKFYMQFAPAKTGYLELENVAGSKVSVSLCSSGKKAVSGTKTLSAYSSKNHKDGKTITGYGVIKNKTYLLCVKAASSVKKVSFKTSLKSYSSVGGSSFSKAKTLSVNKRVYATLGAGSKPSYFKFQKSSYSRKNVTVKTLRNQGKLRVRLYYKEVKGKKKGKILPVKVNGKQIGWTQSSEYQKTLKIPSNWPKVTYYLQISNENSKSTGSYQVIVK